MTTILFRSAALAALLHGLDDAVADRRAVAAALAVAVALAAVSVFPRLRPGLRSLVSLSFGVLALVNGAQHVAGDHRFTGVLAAVAGLVLVGLAVAIPIAQRGSRGWTSRAMVTAGGGLVLWFVTLPLAAAIVQVHKHRKPIPAPPTAAYLEVAFRAHDGVRLTGWYVPSRNRAAVLLVHGGGGDRTGALAHARMLARHRYGVLLYDARGRGDSGGAPNAYGWDWPDDVAGAIDFLRHRPDVDPRRIAALGLSTGADVLIEVAATRHDLAAVVGDGATARSFADAQPLGWFNAAGTWPVFAATRVLSGSEPGPALAQLVPRVAPTPLLLISSGRFPGERELNERYARVARPPFEWWDLRDVHHTAGIRERAAAYDRRVVGFIDRAINPPG